MKNNLHISIFLVTSFLMLLASCEKEVQLELEEKDSKLAILCNFTPDEPFNVELTKSTSLSTPTTTNSNLIEDAEIIICSGSYCAPAFPVPSLSDANSKYQPSDELIIPKVDTTYNITIKLDGFDPITAESTIPQPAEISHSSVGVITKYPIFEQDSIQGYDIRIAFQFLDNQNVENFYQVNFYQVLAENSNNATTDPDTVPRIVPNQGFSLIDNNLTGNFNLIDGGILFNDFTFEKSLQELVFEPVFQFDERIYKPTEIIIELRTVSAEYYNYYNSVYRQNGQASVPFSDPTIIHSNVENGLGIFAGYSKDIIKTDIVF